MKSIIFTLIFLICAVGICFANPFVVASPIENNVQYYVINIDGQDEYLPIDWDMNFIYDMGYLQDDKRYSCGLAAGNDEGESPPLKFIIERKSNKNWVFFTIEKIPELVNDPYYNSRFVDDELNIKIKRDYVVPSGDPLSNDPLINPTQSSSSGGGGGCFISITK